MFHPLTVVFYKIHLNNLGLLGELFSHYLKYYIKICGFK
jgi:hypothetical protein